VPAAVLQAVTEDLVVVALAAAVVQQFQPQLGSVHQIQMQATRVELEVSFLKAMRMEAAEAARAEQVRMDQIVVEVEQVAAEEMRLYTVYRVCCQSPSPQEAEEGPTLLQVPAVVVVAVVALSPGPVMLQPGMAAVAAAGRQVAVQAVRVS
jgi:predicted DNA-binding ribbon-helix-helix protein